MIGIGKDEAFGIDRNLFKTREERRLAQQVKQREQEVEIVKHLDQVAKSDELIDTQHEAKALDTVGAPRAVSAPSGAETPSAESSSLKAMELRP